MSRRRLHVAIEREMLIAEVRRLGAAKVLTGWSGTDAEAIAALEADTRAWIVADAACDNRAEDGHCLGHVEPEPAPKALSDMTEAELEADLRRRRAEEPEPIHTWFELTYSSYLVLPRSILQSMPVEWQRRFVECLHELRDAAEPLEVNDRYTVLLRGAGGRIVKDPFCDYQRGRRRVPLRITEPA